MIFNIWFFDSGNHGCKGDPSLGFGCIEPEVVEWYKRESDRIEEEQGERRPAIAFFHIPPQEFMEGWMVLRKMIEVMNRIIIQLVIKFK